jgi:phage terminase small subunit
VQEVDADLKDLVDPNNELKSIHDWPVVWRQGLVSGLEFGETYEGAGKRKRKVVTVKRIRLSDRVRRLALIGKHNQINAFRETAERNELEGLGDQLEEAFKRLQEAGEE